MLQENIKVTSKQINEVKLTAEVHRKSSDIDAIKKCLPTTKNIFQLFLELEKYCSSDSVQEPSLGSIVHNNN